MTLFTIFSLSSCSILGGYRTNLNIQTSQDDAKIYINGAYVGTGNVDTLVKRNKTVSILVKKDGFHPATESIPTKLSGLGILDAIGGCLILVPFIGLIFPGAWTIAQDNVSIILQKEQ